MCCCETNGRFDRLVEYLVSFLELVPTESHSQGVAQEEKICHIGDRNQVEEGPQFTYQASDNDWPSFGPALD